MTFDDVPHVAHYLLEKHGLAQLGWRFAWDRARRRAGQCRYRSKTISISRHYVALNVVDRPGDVVDTILHEIAHALAPGANHGPAWRAACDRVGAKPERCYDASTVAMPRGKFTATCGACGKEFSRHRAVKPGRFAYCTRCGPERGRLAYHDTSPQHTAAPVAQATPLAPRRLE